MKLTLWSIALALVMWTAMFHPPIQAAVNFWVMMPIATTLLGSLTLIAGGTVFQRSEFNLRNITIGILSAFLLYGIFYVGNSLMTVVASMFPTIIPNKTEQIQTVYSQGSSVPRAIVGLMLFFPIGCGEELFWRGMVQRTFETHGGRVRGLIFTVIVYTAVHIPTMNIMLILAAFTCGLFWGLVYFYTRSVVPGTISHMVWDPLIFAVAPIL